MIHVLGHYKPGGITKYHFPTGTGYLQSSTVVERKAQSCSIAVLDLDHLKTINDQYGHSSGDYVLTNVCRYIIENIRPYDKLFRMGGEEFLICFQNATTKQAFKLVERLRLGIAKKQINITENKFVHITASFGIASINTDSSVEESIENADKALYHAKKEGRNNTKAWD